MKHWHRLPFANFCQIVRSRFDRRRNLSLLQQKPYLKQLSMAATSTSRSVRDADADVLKQANFFAKHDPNEKTKACVQSLLAGSDDVPEGVHSSVWAPAGSGTADEVRASLRKLFGARLKFGTAGLRGPMGSVVKIITPSVAL